MLNFKEITDKVEYDRVFADQQMHILQSWQWGEVKKIEGWQPLRIGVYFGDQLTGVFLIQTKDLPLVGGRFGYIPKFRGISGLDKVGTQVLGKFVSDLGLAFLIWEFDDQDAAAQFSFLSKYSGHVQPQQTDIVDLTKTEEGLFMAMDGNYRRNIKKAQREGVIVQEYSQGQEALDRFYDVMQQVFLNTKYLARDKKYFQNVWEQLSYIGCAHIFTADLNGISVGSYLVINDNSGAYELYGGVSNEGRKVEASYLLKWEAFRYFQSVGKKSYDHWGVAPRLASGEYKKTHELYQISLFKQGFGGNYHEFPAPVVQILNNWKYKMFLGMNSMNNGKIKLTKMFKR